MAEPYPKSRQLARGNRRYRRKIASAKQWQAIMGAKGNKCRVKSGALSACQGEIQYHHVVLREDFGDDVVDNIVPLCQLHHERVTQRRPVTSLVLMKRLTANEYAYMIERGGEGYPERAYGIVYSR